jgi:hypothetical protein
MTGPTIAAQRRFELARRHSGANNPRPGTNKPGRRKPTLLLDTHLSSSPLLANSTRHSVTSRIESNSRLLSYLTFSTRHLNATLEKRSFVEKFNTRYRNFDRISIGRLECLDRSKIRPAQTPSPNARPESVTHVSGTKCYPCLRAGPAIEWWAIKDLNLGPLPCEGSALTTELIARFCNCVKRCCVNCSCSGSHLF